MVAKRALDLTVTIIGILLVAPLMLVIALAIRCDSAGPVLFRQPRVGRHGRLFMMHKFRSMTVDSPTFGPKPQTYGDERVTRVGRFLRQSSLDELPQLFNVLRGEMSIVGPRPEQPFLVDQYEQWQCERLLVPPGMTGWWQVNGRKQPMHLHVEEDLFYVRNHSIRLDLHIMARTIAVVLRGSGAV